MSDDLQPLALKMELPVQAAGNLVLRARHALSPFLATVDSNEWDIRIHACEREDTAGDDEALEEHHVYYAWIGVNGRAPQGDVHERLHQVRAHWASLGWEIRVFDVIDNGGVYLFAVDGEGNEYRLDSGFDADPQAAWVGFFSTPCFRSPGEVQYGAITVGL